MGEGTIWGFKDNWIGLLQLEPLIPFKPDLWDYGFDCNWAIVDDHEEIKPAHITTEVYSDLHHYKSTPDLKDLE